MVALNNWVPINMKKDHMLYSKNFNYSKQNWNNCVIYCSNVNNTH